MRSLQLYSLLLLLSLTGYTAGGSTPSGSTKSKHTPSHMPSSSHTSHVAASGSASTLSHSTGLNTSMASSHHPTHSTVSPHPSHNSNRKSSLWPASGFKRTTPASVRVSSDGTSHLVPKGTGHFSSGTYHHRGTGSMRPTGHSTRSRGNLYSGMSGHAPSHTGNATRYASSSYRPRPTGSATKMQNSTSHHTTSSVMGTWKSGDCKLSTFMNPTTTISCKTTTLKPMQVTACHCPNDQYYEEISGPGGACPYVNDNQKDLLEALWFSCPTPIPTAAPTNVPTPSYPPDGGRFPVNPTYPATCWSPTVAFSETKPMKTGQILIDPNVDWGKVGSVWEFSAGNGVRITNLTGVSDPDTGDLYSGRPVISNNNFTHDASGDWNMTVVPNMPTEPLIAITEGPVGSNGTFPMTIISTIPCNLPVAQNCTDKDHDLNPTQWEAFQVDQFLDEYMQNFTKSGRDNFWEAFVNDFVGDAFPTVCQVDQDTDCGPITDGCSAMLDTPYQRQAYFILASMIALRDYLRFVYEAYDHAWSDLQGILPDWENYFDVPSTQLTWQNCFAMAGSIIGMLAVVGFGVGPFLGPAGLGVGAVSSALFGISGMLNGAINFANIDGSSIQPEIQFQDWSKNAAAMHSFIQGAQKALTDQANAYFEKGTNLTTILKGGVWVASDALTNPTQDSVSGVLDQAATWFDKQAVMGLINEAWKANNNYIVFLPYGNHIGNYGSGTVNFDQHSCETYFQGNSDWNGKIYSCCNCGPSGNEGMAMFMVPQDESEINQYNSKSYYDVQGYHVDGYTFNADDVFKSSLSGYFQYGFYYNATQVDVGSMLDSGNTDPLKTVANLEPTDPGVFNLPICMIYDFMYVPACTVTGWNDEEPDPCVSQPSFCLGKGSNVTLPNGKVQYFKDYANQAIIDGLNDATGYDGYVRKE